jgi:hypothetical protein
LQANRPDLIIRENYNGEFFFKYRRHEFFLSPFGTMDALYRRSCEIN